MRLAFGRFFRSGIILFLCLNISGCSTEGIIEDKTKKYRIEAVEDDDLELDSYYVKNGTKFYKVYNCDKSNGSASGVDSKRCAWVLDAYSAKIPTYYENEFLAYASKKTEIEEAELERYRDSGYSIGVHNVEYRSDGYFAFKKNQSIISDTSASKAFKDAKSDEILIETINGQRVSDKMLNKAGVILGLDKNADYKITYYAGTYYGTAIIKSDVHFFQSYEAYIIPTSSIEITKNGYLSIKLNKDMKTGYYTINNKGIFRYVQEEKGAADLDTLDYNDPYFSNAEDQLAAYSQQYTFELPAQIRDAKVVAEFDPYSIPDMEDPDIKMMVTSPSGERVVTNANFYDNTITASFTSLMPGKWIINISPRTLYVNNVALIDNTEKQDKTVQTYHFAFNEEEAGLKFIVKYKGSGEVTAQVIGPDGQSHDMTKPLTSDRSNTLEYSFSYLPTGNYDVNVYHDPDTIIESVSYDVDESTKQETIITIEG